MTVYEMLWFYRHDASLRVVETRYDNDTCDYVLVLHDAAGHTTEERFKTAQLFRERLEQLEQEFAEQRWRPDGAPFFLRTGWAHKRPPR